MKDMFSHFTSIILMTLCFMICFMFIYANTEVSYAKRFHTACVERIQASNMNDTVISDCKSKATSQGWTLTVTDQHLYESRVSEKVVLDYTVTVPLLNGTISGELVGYAR